MLDDVKWTMVKYGEHPTKQSILQHIATHPVNGSLVCNKAIGFWVTLDWQSYSRVMYACMLFLCAFKMFVSTHSVSGACLSGSGSWTRATWASTCKLTSHRMASSDGSLVLGFPTSHVTLLGAIPHALAIITTEFTTLSSQIRSPKSIQINCCSLWRFVGEVKDNAVVRCNRCTAKGMVNASWFGQFRRCFSPCVEREGKGSM